MCLRRNKYFFVFLTAVISTPAMAQTTASYSNPINGRDNNPYSKYGLGELLNGNNVAMRGAGNATSAYANGYSINTDNPASYSLLERTTFELGGVASTRNTTGSINGNPQSYRTGTASIAYMTMAVPVTRHGGFSFGFRPYARTYYSLRDTISSGTVPQSPIDSAELIYKGEGSLNYAFIGGSVRIKGLSAGFNFGYLFGNTFNSTQLNPYDYTNATRSYVSEYSTQTRVGGVMWKGGLMYTAKLDSFITLRIGGSISLNQKINQHFTEYHISGYNFGDTVIRDTAYFQPEAKGKLTLPTSYSGGFMLSKENKWAVMADYSATQWSEFSSDLNSHMNRNIAASSYKMSLGTEYIPDVNDLKHILSRCTYRLGGYYGTDYITPSATTLNYYGITAGMTLPFRRFQTQMSYLHAAIDFGRLGTTDNGLMQQNYLRFSVGFSMTSKWFERAKYQ